MVDQQHDLIRVGIKNNIRPFKINNRDSIKSNSSTTQVHERGRVMEIRDRFKPIASGTGAALKGKHYEWDAMQAYTPNSIMRTAQI